MIAPYRVFAVATGAPGQHEVHLVDNFGIREHGRDRAIAALFLFQAKALVGESLWSVDLHEAARFFSSSHRSLTQGF